MALYLWIAIGSDLGGAARFCGDYDTTSSSFSLQTLAPASDQEWLHAGTRLGLSVVCGLASVWRGHIAAAFLNPFQGP